MKKTCPKCKNEFICKQDDIVNCDCYLIPIDSAGREVLKKTFEGCLCKKCLLEYTNSKPIK
jgi:hypothetical protein